MCRGPGAGIPGQWCGGAGGHVGLTGSSPGYSSSAVRPRGRGLLGFQAHVLGERGLCTLEVRWGSQGTELEAPRECSQRSLGQSLQREGGRRGPVRGPEEGGRPGAGEQEGGGGREYESG